MRRPKRDRRLLTTVAVGVLIGCSSAGTKPSGNSEATGGAVGGGGAGGVTGSGGASPDSGATTADDDAGFKPGDGNLADGAKPVALPTGSRERNGIVNLVDDAAAKELEQFLLDNTTQLDFLRHGLNESLNLFIDAYLEDYDFVYFFTDHAIDNVTAAGVFEPVNRPAEVGGGNEQEIAAGGYKTTGRTKGVAAFPYFTGYYPPLAHETLHYWAVYLDRTFGFGKGKTTNFFAHWGYADINGQLGGYDGHTLRCETPTGGVPPSCTPLPSGGYHYVLGGFGPNANGFRDLAYAPIELYLMGLALPAEVPATIQQLTDADFVSISDDHNTAVVEASGISTLAFADIVARHGTKSPLATADRHFSAAFVVLSSQPASDSVLGEVAHWAAVFGGREATAGWKSFAGYTGGRATMNTALGARRDGSTPPPPARDRFACNVVTQDCGRPELACRMSPPTFCGLAGTGTKGQACSRSAECAVGFDCYGSKCQPFCDASSTTSASSCQTLCPGKYGSWKDSAGVPLAYICLN